MPHDISEDADRTGGARPARQTSAAARASLLDTAPYRIGSVTLIVRDLDGLARFYQDAVGLAVVSQEAGVVRLGVEGRVLLELRHDPAARPWSPREAG
jgi:catechol 2,3-dioxygenase